MIILICKNSKVNLKILEFYNKCLNIFNNNKLILKILLIYIFKSEIFLHSKMLNMEYRIEIEKLIESGELKLPVLPRVNAKVLSIINFPKFSY